MAERACFSWAIGSGSPLKGILFLFGMRIAVLFERGARRVPAARADGLPGRSDESDEEGLPRQAADAREIHAGSS